jgi:predicted transcriptional regulator
VDQLLEEGKVEAAEAYMEERRRYFVANGCRIRRLNEAYFAFHGAYASAPGAAGKDPIGPAVRLAWSLSATPREFLRTLGPITTLAALEAHIGE